MAVANPDRKVLVLWLIAIAMITWRELKAGEVPPAPHAYVGSAIVYGFAAILAEAAGDVGVYLAVGWTLWLAYGLIDVIGRGSLKLGGGAGADGKPKGSTRPEARRPGRPIGPKHSRGPHPRSGTRRRLGSRQAIGGKR